MITMSVIDEVDNDHNDSDYCHGHEGLCFVRGGGGGEGEMTYRVSCRKRR